MPKRRCSPARRVVHPEHGRIRMSASTTRSARASAEAGFARADVIVEGEYRTPYQEHAYLQPEAGLAYLDEQGRMTVECGGQWTHADREQIAHALGLPSEKVRVIYPAIGGAFGGREDMSVQIVLALAAMKLKRRSRSSGPARNRSSATASAIRCCIQAKWGATKDGKLVAAENRDDRRWRRLHVHHQQGAGQLDHHLHRARISSPTSRTTSTAFTPTTSRARPSAASARRRPCGWPNCRWTSWPRNWAWTRWSSATECTAGWRYAGCRHAGARAGQHRGVHRGGAQRSLAGARTARPKTVDGPRRGPRARIRRRLQERWLLLRLPGELLGAGRDCMARARSIRSSSGMPGRRSVRARTPSWRRWRPRRLGIPFEKVTHGHLRLGHDGQLRARSRPPA